MAGSGITPQQNQVRPLQPNDVRALLRLIDSAWRVQLRIAPTELVRKIKTNPGFVAQTKGQLCGFLMIEPLPSNVALFVAGGLRDRWSVPAFLDVLLPPVRQAALERKLQALCYIGHAEWLKDELTQRGFLIREWVLALERTGVAPPAPIEQASAMLRTAHYNDLPALLKLDGQVFEHIWHKSAGSISEALAQAASFRVALIDNKIVAYQWCEMYGRHAHLTRLAVHPNYQGRGIGAQLLHQAITDVVELGANVITLNTQENNSRSQTLYARFGFTPTGERMPVLWQNIA